MSTANRAARSRRELLAVGAAGLVGGLAGCSWNASFPDADVLAGPDGRLVFEPAELTVSVGETVRWGFPRSGHNVCCRPDDSSDVRLPADADPFASYNAGESPQGTLVPLGGTYEHTFHVPGTFGYVCVPHVAQGMTGTVQVE